jgi:nucleotide-binding universal stress UspA family protein
MPTFKNILIPIDFSRLSIEAVRIGSSLAQHFEGSVTLVHVFDPLPYALRADYELFTAEQHRRLTSELEKSLTTARLRADTAGAPAVETQLLEGDVRKGLTEFARAGHFDLIVIGTHGRRGLEQGLLGSIAEHLVRNAPCPVLTVRVPEGESDRAAVIWPPMP